MQRISNSSDEGLLAGKLLHLALPVRWSFVGQEGRATETACTYDIFSNGARLVGSRDVNIGDLLLLERGRNKAICQVVWAAGPESPLRGQFTVQCVENKTPWDDELRQSEEQYQPVVLDGIRFSSRTANRLDGNRRRRPRFHVDGQAELIEGVQHFAGEVHQLSECGARIFTKEKLRPGTEFRLSLTVLDINLALKAQVRYVVGESGMGVEFQEIRRGDRPLLQYVLANLKMNRLEDFVPVEVVHEPLAASAQ